MATVSKNEIINLMWLKTTTKVFISWELLASSIPNSCGTEAGLNNNYLKMATWTICLYVWTGFFYDNITLKSLISEHILHFKVFQHSRCFWHKGSYKLYNFIPHKFPIGEIAHLGSTKYFSLIIFNFVAFYCISHYNVLFVL